MISEQDLDAITMVIKDGILGDHLARQLKAQWPQTHFTYCSDDDVSAGRPVRAYKDFNLYFVSSSGGCISFTSNREQATGLVIAEIEEEQG